MRITATAYNYVITFINELVKTYDTVLHGGVKIDLRQLTVSIWFPCWLVGGICAGEQFIDF